MTESQTNTAVLRVGGNRAEIRYHLKDGRVVVDGIFNLDHGVPIQCTTPMGSAFNEVAAECAKLVESDGEELMVA